MSLPPSAGDPRGLPSRAAAEPGGHGPAQPLQGQRGQFPSPPPLRGAATHRGHEFGGGAQLRPAASALPAPPEFLRGGAPMRPLPAPGAASAPLIGSPAALQPQQPWPSQVPTAAPLQTPPPAPAIGAPPAPASLPAPPAFLSARAPEAASAATAAGPAPAGQGLAEAARREPPAAAGSEQTAAGHDAGALALAGATSLSTTAAPEPLGPDPWEPLISRATGESARARGGSADPARVRRQVERAVRRNRRRPVRSQQLVAVAPPRSAVVQQTAAPGRPAGALLRTFAASGVVLAFVALFALPGNGSQAQAGAGGPLGLPQQQLAEQAYRVENAAVAALDRDTVKTRTYTPAWTNEYTYVTNPLSAIQWPIPFTAPLSSPYGMRPGGFHAGMDITPGLGAPIVSIADGVIKDVNNFTFGYGSYVVISHHELGIATIYAHMIRDSNKIVKKGQHVTAGQQIGKVGSTGKSTGPHLHFEIWIDGKTVNPFTWLKENAIP